MRIQHNIMALNSNRQLGVNNSAVAKSLEKLSSGYRINRAGDDAAGLAISEKMRAQIKGLEAATDNSQDAISLIQTAEGGLQEVHSMLNRMTELATKSANGTYTDDVDRKALQDEISALKDEINRIADGTDFNGIKLLDGSMGVGTAGQVGAATVNAATGITAATNFTFQGPEGYSVQIGAGTGASEAKWDGKTLQITLNNTSGKIYTQSDIDALVKNASGVPSEAAGKVSLTMDKDSITMGTAVVAGTTNILAKTTSEAAVKATSEDTNGTGITLTATKAGANSSTLTIGNAGAAGASVGVDGNVTLNIDTTKSYTANELNKMLEDAGAEMRLSFDGAKSGADIYAAQSDAGTDHVLKLGENGKAGTGLSAGGGLTLQIGDTNDAYNQLELSIGDMHVNALDLSSVDISTREGASAAMAKIKAAINTVSTGRGKLGAIQNRLEHTINNLGVTTENITSAESRIRDVDMAKEMMNYTKNSVLVQSAQAMLAQANQQPQSILQLLQ